MTTNESEHGTQDVRSDVTPEDITEVSDFIKQDDTAVVAFVTESGEDGKSQGLIYCPDDADAVEELTFLAYLTVKELHESHLLAPALKVLQSNIMMDEAAAAVDSGGAEIEVE